MRKLVLKSIEIHKLSTIILSGISLMLALISAGLIVAYIHQTNHYHELLDKQATVFQETLDEMTDNYLEIVKAEQPMKNVNYPKRNAGKFQLSFYTPHELGKSAEKLRTATGSTPREGRTIAVDPKVIPFGSTVYIEGYGYYIAEDTGSAIKGNRIDIFMLDYNKAISLGKPYANVTILGRK